MAWMWSDSLLGFAPHKLHFRKDLTAVCFLSVYNVNYKHTLLCASYFGAVMDCYSYSVKTGQCWGFDMQCLCIFYEVDQMFSFLFVKHTMGKQRLHSRAVHFKKKSNCDF